jgi:hypothetical protein
MRKGSGTCRVIYKALRVQNIKKGLTFRLSILSSLIRLTYCLYSASPFKRVGWFSYVSSPRPSPNDSRSCIDCRPVTPAGEKALAKPAVAATRNSLRGAMVGNDTNNRDERQNRAQYVAQWKTHEATRSSADLRHFLSSTTEAADVATYSYVTQPTVKFWSSSVGKHSRFPKEARQNWRTTMADSLRRKWDTGGNGIRTYGT